ncbi:MAG: hypothetical protein ABEK50_16450 [bacterium]
MATFDTIDEVERAYRKLVRTLKGLRKDLQSDDEVDWEAFDEALAEQDEIVERIQESESLVEKFQANRPDRYETLLEEFETLNEKLSQEIMERKQETKKELDSLDQSEEILDEYDQELGSNYHLDETV